MEESLNYLTPRARAIHPWAIAAFAAGVLVAPLFFAPLYFCTPVQTWAFQLPPPLIATLFLVVPVVITVATAIAAFIKINRARDQWKGGRLATCGILAALLWVGMSFLLIFVPHV